MKRVTIIRITIIPATESKPTRIRIKNTISGKSIVITKSYYYRNNIEQAENLLRFNNVICNCDSFDKNADYLITESDEVDNALQHIKESIAARKKSIAVH